MVAPRLAWGLVALALLAPLAAAAGAQGTLQVAGEARTLGDSTLDAAHGSFLSNGTEVPTLQLAGASFTVERYGQSWSQQATPIGDVNVQPPTQVRESKALGAGTLTLEKGTATQLIAFRTDAPVTLTLTDATIKPTKGVLLARIVTANDDYSGKCASAQCLDDHGVYEFATPRSQGALTGDITLLLHGPTVLVNADGSQQRFTSGSAKTGNAPMQQTEETWVIIHVKAAQGTILAAAPAHWYAPAPRLQTASAQADDATGDVTVGLSGYRATSEPLEIGGALKLSFDAVEPGNWGNVATATYAQGFTAHVNGDITKINLHAKPVYQQAPAASAGIAALVAVGAALAYYWPLVSFHAMSAALPLYTRLKQPEILANEVRNSIYEIIRGQPGISAREVHRQSEQSWGTVVYHLRQLERHHLVVSRSVGRTRNYYENHGKYRGMEVQLACLQSSRARALARIVLDTPGISQEELVTRSAFPQPTTSYYVRKLKGAGLVEERREGRYARYHPMPDLARFLQLADAHPITTVEIAPAGVEG